MARVAKYGKPEEMEKLIDDYFAKFENPEPLRDTEGRIILSKEGSPVYREELPTSAGLAYFLGFSSRCSLWEYEQKPTFARVVKRAKLRLQSFWEPKLATKSASGAQFWLQNIKDDWRDVKQIEDIGTKAPPQALIVFVDKETKSAKAAQIPTIEAEVIDAQTQAGAGITALDKPKRKASAGKKLGRPKKRGRPRGGSKKNTKAQQAE